MENVNIDEVRALDTRDKVKRLFAEFPTITDTVALKVPWAQFQFATVRYAVVKWNKTAPVKLAFKQKKPFMYVFVAASKPKATGEEK